MNSRILVDLQGTQSLTHGERGIPRYITQFAITAERQAPGRVSTWLLSPDLPVPPSIEPLFSTGRLTTTWGEVPPAVYHVTSPFESPELRLTRVWPTRRSPDTKLVVTLYDLIPLIFADHYLRDPRLRMNYLARLEMVRCADRLLAISEATARDAVRLLGVPPKIVTVVGTGIPEHFRPADSRADAFVAAHAALPDLRPGFCMFTGGVDFRKNLEGTFAGYAALAPDIRAAHQLVVVCRMSAHEHEVLSSLGNDLGISEDLLLTGFVDDDVMLLLYQSAHLFVFPSLYEGYGLPVAEAMACGTPTIAGDNSSLVELLSLNAARFDASSTPDISRALRQGLTDEDVRRRLTAATGGRQTWEGVVERTLAAYDVVLRRLPARPRRLALVSPMPPAQSGVADYTAHLLKELAQRFSVDVFAQADAHHEDLPGVRWFEYGMFDAMRLAEGGYARIIAAMGNSVFHYDVWRIVRDHGGVVMAHDVRLAGFFQEAQKDRPSLVPDEYRPLVWARARGVVPPHLGEYRSFPADQYYRTNAPMIGAVMRAAERTYVHSTYSLTAARLDCPERADSVRILPFALSGRFARAGDIPETPPVVVSMGMVSTTKQAEKLCEAFVALASARPDLTCAFVGELTTQELTKELRSVIADGGVADRVLLTDRIDEAGYAAWLTRAHVSVQLREASNGETSAAVFDCLEAGVPVVTTEIGSAAELPRDAVKLVDRDIPAADLARVIDEMLSDPRARTRMVASAQAFVAGQTFGAVADILVGDLPPEWG